MTTAKERLKRVADRLSEDDAAIVLSLARSLLRRRVANTDAEDRADLEAAREALAEPERIPYDAVRRQRGC